MLIISDVKVLIQNTRIIEVQDVKIQVAKCCIQSLVALFETFRHITFLPHNIHNMSQLDSRAQYEFLQKYLNSARKESKSAEEKRKDKPSKTKESKKDDDWLTK